MPDEFEHLIERSLDERSADLRVGHGSMDDVLLRVDRRSNRRRATAVASSLAVIAVGLVGLSAVQGADRPAGPASAGPATAPATSAPLALVEGLQDAYRCTNQIDVTTTPDDEGTYYARCEHVALQDGRPMDLAPTTIVQEAPVASVECAPTASSDIAASTVACGTVLPAVQTVCEEGDVATSVWVTVPCPTATTTWNDAAPAATVPCGSLPNGTVPCATTTIVWPVAQGEQEYMIREGDDPARIADLFQVPLDVLAAYNEGRPAWESFRIGSTILIPPGSIIPDG